MSKKILFISIAIIIITVGVVAVLKFSGEDSWICADGQWVKHGNPNAPMPATGCGNGSISTSTENGQIEDMPLKITKPLPDEEISSPLAIEGEMRGNWFFEASFPIRLEDSSGRVLARGIAQAQGDWMTTDYVPFKSRLEFMSSTTQYGQLIFEKDNPSGLPINGKEIKMPVIIKATIVIATTTIKVYFMNNKLDPEITCTKVFPAERIAQKTPAIARVAIEELLKGPADNEKTGSYRTSLPQTVIKIQKLTIENGLAKIDFNQALEEGVAGSCRVSAIRAQIEETLKQFPTVQDVIISIDGRTEDVLQP